MRTRSKIAYRVNLLLPALLLWELVTSCAPTFTLVGPTEPNSSLVIGRVVVFNKFSGAYRGLLPLGNIDQGIEVEVESLETNHVLKAITQEQGYFFIPNISPNIYHIRRVSIEGGVATSAPGPFPGWGTFGGASEKYGVGLGDVVFRPVPGKIAYLGALNIEISEGGDSMSKVAWEEEQARSYFFDRHGGSPWASREFTTAKLRRVPQMRFPFQSDR